MREKALTAERQGIEKNNSRLFTGNTGSTEKVEQQDRKTKTKVSPYDSIHSGNVSWKWRQTIRQGQDVDNWNWGTLPVRLKWYRYCGKQSHLRGKYRATRHVHVKSLQSCLTPGNPMDCSPPGSSVHRISQAGMLEWVAMPFSRGSSQPRDWTCVSCISCIGRWILYHCATWEAP